LKVLGIYGSPRQGGNSDLLLDKALEGARSAGAETISLYARDLKMNGCIECGGCDDTGQCVVDDDMQKVYPLLQEADLIFISSPMFFYSFPAQVKALIDRCQAMWNLRMLTKKGEERHNYHRGSGYLIAVGATHGKNLFEGAKLVARYFFDALHMEYKEGLFFKGLEKKSAAAGHPETLEQAYEFGRHAVEQADSDMKELSADG
jgi:multimeric flavodoxin WrbA